MEQRKVLQNRPNAGFSKNSDFSKMLCLLSKPMDRIGASPCCLQLGETYIYVSERARGTTVTYKSILVSENKSGTESHLCDLADCPRMYRSSPDRPTFTASGTEILVLSALEALGRCFQLGLTAFRRLGRRGTVADTTNNFNPPKNKV